MLLGTYDLRLDDKNRITIPAKLRERLLGTVFVTHGLDGCLFGFSQAGWDSFVARQLSELDSFSHEARQMQRHVLPAVADGELDRQGRFALPTRLVEHAGLERDVTVIAGGSGNLGTSLNPFNMCALQLGALKCWTAGVTPVTVVGMEAGVTAVSVGGFGTTCAVKGGGAWCWGGNNIGQLGDLTTTDSAVPVRVAGLTSGVTAISI